MVEIEGDISLIRHHFSVVIRLRHQGKIISFSVNALVEVWLLGSIRHHIVKSSTTHSIHCNNFIDGVVSHDGSFYLNRLMMYVILQYDKYLELRLPPKTKNKVIYFRYTLTSMNNFVAL